MSHKIYIGIDNGATGTIGWVGENLCPGIEKTPVKKEQSYTKAKKKINEKMGIDENKNKEVETDDIVVKED